MKAPFIINYNGKWYKAGEDLPPEADEQVKAAVGKYEDAKITPKPEIMSIKRE